MNIMIMKTSLELTKHHLTDLKKGKMNILGVMFVSSKSEI